MRLIDSFSLPPTVKCISVVGAGGKTSLIFRLAREFCEDGLKCVIMTTTHIYPPASDQAVTITDRTPSPMEALKNALGSTIPVAIGTFEESTGKLCMPPADLLAEAWAQADRILVEADGSRHFPIKAPAAHEPMILEPSDRVIAVAGLSALGKPLSEVCQRAGLAASLLDELLETPVTPLIIARLLTSDQGQFKNVLDPSRFSVYLNQADDEIKMKHARETANHIKSFIPGCTVVAGSLQNENQDD